MEGRSENSNATSTGARVAKARRTKAGRIKWDGVFRSYANSTHRPTHPSRCLTRAPLV